VEVAGQPFSEITYADGGVKEIQADECLISASSVGWCRRSSILGASGAGARARHDVARGGLRSGGAWCLWMACGGVIVWVALEWLAVSRSILLLVPGEV
jgi:hypothetical protein